MNHIQIDEFCKSFDTEVKTFSKKCLTRIEEGNFDFEYLNEKERDRTILDVLKKIEHDNQIIGTPDRQEIWMKGWAENFDMYINSSYDLSALVPKFIKDRKIIRFNSDYIKPSNPRFEYDYMTVFRHWLFEQYFSKFDNIYEFGCGTGLNLVLLSEIFPEKSYFGSDFVPSSVDLVNKVGEKLNRCISAQLFNMVVPDYNFKIKRNSLVFTFGAIEQLASNFHNLINYILYQKPDRCVHIEPTIELYDENNLIDYLAIKFHEKRGYTTGLLTHLRELERDGKVEIEKVKRLGFGSLFMEGYMYYIWKPL